MLAARVVGSNLVFFNDKNERIFSITFHRTLRLPDDGKTYGLPPSCGNFPIREVARYKNRVPEKWLKHGGVFIPLWQREALWMGFNNEQNWRPKALKVAAGKINAVSGQSWEEKMVANVTRNGKELQDYMVVPPQPWLDGFKTEENVVRQFTAMPLGMGYTVEGQVTGKEEHGGMQIILYESKVGKFPVESPYRGGILRGRGISNDDFCYDSAPMGGGLESYSAPKGLLSTGGSRAFAASVPTSRGVEMGLAAGGKMTQDINKDPHGIDTWDENNTARVFVHIVNSQMWTEITGERLPASPISARDYTQRGWPWYELWTKEENDVAVSDTLANIKSMGELDEQHGFDVDDNAEIRISRGQVVTINKPNPVTNPLDGNW